MLGENTYDDLLNDAVFYFEENYDCDADENYMRRNAVKQIFSDCWRPAFVRKLCKERDQLPLSVMRKDGVKCEFTRLASFALSDMRPIGKYTHAPRITLLDKDGEEVYSIVLVNVGCTLHELQREIVLELQRDISAAR